MKLTAWALVLGVCAGLMGGCGARTTVFSSAGEIDKLDAAEFGIADWLRDVSKLETTALVTTYDDNGAARVSTQHLTIRPTWGRITATCYQPSGKWTATFSLDGWGLVNPLATDFVIDSGDMDLSDAEEEKIANMLRLILHRVRGPINLLGGGEKVVQADQVFAAGYEMDRFRCEGREELSSAYFFGDEAESLRLVTQGGWEPGDAGTVTVYRNMRTPDGIMMPAELEVSNLGENSLIGRKKLLSVRLTDVKINR